MKYTVLVALSSSILATVAPKDLLVISPYPSWPTKVLFLSGLPVCSVSKGRGYCPTPNRSAFSGSLSTC